MTTVRSEIINTIIGLWFFCSCNNGQENVLTIPSKDSSKPESLTDPSASYDNNNQSIDRQDTLNYTDSAGLKQGIWKKYLNGKIWKIENYKDNFLHGKNYEYSANGEVMETDYRNGIRHGYFLQYNPDSTFGKFVTYWENGKQVWSAFPWELESYIVPVKGFLTEKEKVEIKVPYNSGKLMYQGTIVAKEGNSARAIGLHKAYYESGELKATVDYDKDSINIYRKDGKLIESEKIYKWKGRRIE